MAIGLSLADQAVECFGVDNQIRKAAEECLELAAALLKIADIAGGFNDITISKAVEEIADVEICIEQLKEVFDSSVISAVKKKKEFRLFDTIQTFRASRDKNNRGRLEPVAPWETSGAE